MFQKLIESVVNGEFMPTSDFPALEVHGWSGHQRENKAWVIGRLLRDFEKRASPLPSDRTSPARDALRVSVFKWDDTKEQDRPDRDWVWYSGFAIIVL